MADGDDPLPGGSYSELLFADDDNIVSLVNSDGLFGPKNSSVSTQMPPKMLSFGGDYQQQQQKQRECDFQYPPAQRTTQKSGLTCSDSSSASSINNAKIKKRNGYGDEAAAAQSLSTGTGAPVGSQRSSSKKIESENSAAGNGHAKVRKEKLGERVSALLQLVSPFGKTDTASVLHAAAGYIKFLHDQVQVLCSPYLQHLPSSNQAQLPEGGGTAVSGFGQEGVGTGENESRNDLRSRGLCLVPVDCTTMHMASNNGADFWSPAAMGKKISSAQH